MLYILLFVELGKRIREGGVWLLEGGIRIGGIVINDTFDHILKGVCFVTGMS